MSVDPTLIGREAEIVALATALDRAGAGGTILLITGEAGIGKTALIEQYVARAQTANADIAWATVPDAEGAPPYWPWAGILHELADKGAGNALTAAADALTTPDQPMRPPDQERFRIFDQVARALRAIGSPAFVVIDDLHRADGATLRLLEFLAPQIRRTKIVLVLGARPAAPGSDLAGTFGALVHAGATRIDLQPWSEHEIGQALRRFGLGTPAGTIAQVQHATGGNPFFVLELARGARESGGTIDVGRIPPSVIDVIGAEVRRLDPTQVDILRLAAIWGQGAPLELLVDAAGQPSAAAAQSLPEGFLSLDRDRAVWFRHDLVREAVYHGVPGQDRAALHGRLAAAIERSTLSPEARARQIAVHGCRAGVAWKPDVAFAAALAAARDAGSMYALESAVTYLELANTVRRWCAPAATIELEFLVTYGEALTRAGDRERARPVLNEAVALAQRIDDARALARIALVVGLGTETAGVPDRDARRLLDEALAKLPPDEHLLRSRLLARQAWQALAASEVEILAASSEAAVTEARASGDPGAIAGALNAYWVSTLEQESAVRREIAREITAQATLAHDIDLVFSGLLWEAHGGLETGNIDAARDAARRYEETAERWPLPYHAWYRWILRAALAFLDDRLDDAAAAIEQLDPATTTQREFATLLHATQRLELAARRGDRAEFERLGAAVLARLEFVPVYHALRAHIDACLGRRDAALAALDRFIATLPEGPHDNDWLAALTEGALAAIRLDARAQAVRLFERIEPYRGRWTVIANATVSRGPVSAVLAGLARLIGDADAAAVYEAETAADLRRAGTPGARFWAENGPRWLQGRDLAAPVAGLTAREVEVLSLVAAGCSNQEIADRLVLSIRTVQRHVENIYGKTGARGRAAVAVFAATHGLIGRVS